MLNKLGCLILIILVSAPFTSCRLENRISAMKLTEIIEFPVDDSGQYMMLRAFRDNIFVFDFENGIIQNFDYKGKLKKRFGGKGSAPGEYKSIPVLSWNGNINELTVYDPYSYRFTIYSEGFDNPEIKTPDNHCVGLLPYKSGKIYLKRCPAEQNGNVGFEDHVLYIESDSLIKDFGSKFLKNKEKFSDSIDYLLMVSANDKDVFVLNRSENDFKLTQFVNGENNRVWDLTYSNIRTKDSIIKRFFVTNNYVVFSLMDKDYYSHYEFYDLNGKYLGVIDKPDYVIFDIYEDKILYLSYDKEDNYTCKIVQVGF